MLLSIFDIEFSPHKHLVHFERIRALAEGREAAPVTLELDISSRCNHTCGWCVDPPGSHTSRDMPVDTARRIMEEAREMDVRGIVFKGGGESTLHPEFSRILGGAAGLGFEVGVVTNGSRLGRTSVRNALVDHAAYVRVSIDGPTPESHHAIHGSRDFEPIISGVRELLALRGDRRHPVIGLTFCLDFARRGLIDACIRLGERLAPDYILIRPPFCEEVGFTAPHTPEQAAQLRDDILSAAAGHNGRTPVLAGNWMGDREMGGNGLGKKPLPLARRDSGLSDARYNGIEHRTGRCPAAPLFLVITADAEVFGCCCLRGLAPFSYGAIDYAGGHTLATVMQGPEREESLGKMRKASCLQHCTHPLSRINELIEYLSLPEKHHAGFI